jgi:hypothetical protein
MLNGQILGLLAFAVVAGTMFRWFQLVHAVAIPQNRTMFYGFLGTGALLGLIALMNQPGWIVGTLAVLSLLVGSVFPLLRLRSGQVSKETTAPVGSQVPSFAALDDAGVRFESSSLAGTPYLLKFFRGHW